MSSPLQHERSQPWLTHKSMNSRHTTHFSDFLVCKAFCVRKIGGLWRTGKVRPGMTNDYPDFLTLSWRDSAQWDEGVYLFFSSQDDIDLFLAESNVELSRTQDYVRLMRRLGIPLVLTAGELHEILAAYTADLVPAESEDPLYNVANSRVGYFLEGKPYPQIFDDKAMQAFAYSCMRCIRKDGRVAERYARFAAQYKEYVAAAQGLPSLAAYKIVDTDHHLDFFDSRDTHVEEHLTVDDGDRRYTARVFNNTSLIDIECQGTVKIWLPPVPPKNMCDCHPAERNAQRHPMIPLDIQLAGTA